MPAPASTPTAFAAWRDRSTASVAQLPSAISAALLDGLGRDADAGDDLVCTAEPVE